MNHVKFLPSHYHYHSCLCLFELCRDNFVTRTFTSFHSGFCSLVCSFAKKLFFSQFECITPHCVYCLYCLVCLHRKQKEAYVTENVFLLFLHSNIKPHFVFCLHCVACLHIKQKVTHTLFCSTILICKLETN